MLRNSTLFILFIFIFTTSIIQAQVNPDSAKSQNDSIPVIIKDTTLNFTVDSLSTYQKEIPSQKNFR